MLYAIWQYVFFCAVVESKKQFRWFHNTASMAPKTLKIPIQCAVFYDTKVLTVILAFSPTRPLRLTLRCFSPTRQLRWLLPRTLRWLASTLLPTLRPTNYRYVFRAIRCRCFRWHCTFTGKLCFLAEVSALLRMLSWGYCAWLFMIDKSFCFRSIIIFCIIPSPLLLPLFRDNPLASLWESLHELHSMANYVL